MAITLELSCPCGATSVFEGSRRGEREAKEQWAAAHGGHGVTDPEAEEADMTGIAAGFRMDPEAEEAKKSFYDVKTWPSSTDQEPEVGRRRTRAAAT